MIFTTILCLVIFALSNGADILGILPHPGKSHNLVTTPFFMELANRGHNVTVLGYFTPSNPPSNYRTILLDPAGIKSGYYTFDLLDRNDENFAVWNMRLFLDLAKTYSPAVRKNAQSLKVEQKHKYDLVIVEYFNADSFLGFVEALGVPFIFFHTSEPIPWHRTLIGDPLETSYAQHPYPELERELDFRGRLSNFLETYWMLYQFQTTFQDCYEAEASSAFRPKVPLMEIAKNASLYLVNTHFSFTGTRPVNPSTIEVGGINIQSAQPLPEDLQTLMDSSENGVIFFSMGSVIKGASLDEKKRDVFLKVFSQLKQTVLWKWESELPNKPPNVHTSAWLPQRDIFAHHNLKLYIGHCGLLGVHEAISEAVPTICLPMFADQNFNAQRLKKTGMGFGLNFRDLDEHELRSAILKVLSDSTYKENASRISKAFLDRPMGPMETAIYWTEYVLRHNGAPHLKSPARYMSWIEYHNIDVIAFIVTLLLIVSYGILKTVSTLLLRLFSRKKEKIN